MPPAKLYEVSLEYTKKIDGVLSYFDEVYCRILQGDEHALVEYAGVMKHALFATQRFKEKVRAGDEASLLSAIPQFAFVEGEVKRLKFALTAPGADY